MGLLSQPKRATIARGLAFFWRGPADLPGTLKLEWRVAAARWVALGCVVPGLALMSLSVQQQRAAAIILLLGFLYNAFVVRLIFTRPDVIARGYATTLGDLLLNTAMMISLGGGFDSAYSYIFFALIISVAMRFSQRAALGASALVVIVNVIANIVLGLGFDSGFVFRSLFLGLTAILASFLREQEQRAAADLRESNQALQLAYGELHEAHQQLLSLDAAKSNFVANVSHELRTPLTSIRAYSELLLTYDESPDVQREFLGIINTESDRLTRLVNDVLDVMKIEAGIVGQQTVAVDLADLVRYTVQVYSPLAAQQRIELRQDISHGLPSVRGDRDRLLQVFGNLVANAIKFTAQGSITLSSALVGREIRIAVSDTGPGITPDDQPHIFEKFYQGGPLLTGKPNGSGLGLAICKEIVAQHGGRIWVESTPGEGSTFVVALDALIEPGVDTSPLAVGTPSADPSPRQSEVPVGANLPLAHVA